MRIPVIARHVYADVGGQDRWPSPFSTEPSDSFFNWLNRSAGGPRRGGPLISNLALGLHRQRPDLQRAFPDPLGAHRWAYAAWFASRAGEQEGLEEAFLGPVRASLGPGRGRAPLGSRVFYGARAALRRLGVYDLAVGLLGARAIRGLYRRLVARG